MSNPVEKLRAIADALPDNYDVLAAYFPEKKSPEYTDRHYRKKPVVIQAVQWTGDNLYEVIAFTDGPPDIRSMHASMKWDEYRDLVARDGLMIFTLEGKMLANVGDWIIKGVKGEHYPCKPDIFAATYEPAFAPSPAMAQPVADEREAFEAAWMKINKFQIMNQRRHDDGRYADYYLEKCWQLWQVARAARDVPAGEGGKS